MAERELPEFKNGPRLALEHHVIDPVARATRPIEISRTLPSYRDAGSQEGGQSFDESTAESSDKPPLLLADILESGRRGELDRLIDRGAMTILEQVGAAEDGQINWGLAEEAVSSPPGQRFLTWLQMIFRRS